MTSRLRLTSVLLLASVALGHTFTDWANPSLPAWWLQTATRTLDELLALEGLGALLALTLTRIGLSRPSAVLGPLGSLTRLIGLVPVVVWCAALALMAPELGSVPIVLALAVVLGLETSVQSLEARERWLGTHTDPEDPRRRIEWRTATAELMGQAYVLAAFLPRALGVRALVSLLDRRTPIATWGEQLGAGAREGFNLRLAVSLLGVWLVCWAAREAVEPLRRALGFAGRTTTSKTRP